MLRIALTVIIIAVLIFSFGCNKKEQQPVTSSPQTATDVKKQAEKEITKKNMDKELEKIEKEIKADVNAE